MSTEDLHLSGGGGGLEIPEKVTVTIDMDVTARKERWRLVVDNFKSQTEMVYQHCINDVLQELKQEVTLRKKRKVTEAWMQDEGKEHILNYRNHVNWRWS